MVNRFQITTPGTSANRLAFITGARVGTEVIQQSVVMGTLLLSDSLLKQPLEPVKAFVSKHIVLPHLAMMDKTLENFPSLQTPEDTERLKRCSPKEKADIYADTLVAYTLSLGTGLVAQIKGQEIVDRLMKVPNPELNVKHAYTKIAVVDRAAQLGSIIVLNTVGSKPSIAAQNSLQSMFLKIGFTEEASDKASSYLVNWALPNAVGAAAAIGTHFHMSGKMPLRG